MLHRGFILISIPLMANYVEYLFSCLFASARPLTLQRTASRAGWLAVLGLLWTASRRWSSWLPSGVGVGAAVLSSCLAGAEWLLAAVLLLISVLPACSCPGSVARERAGFWRVLKFFLCPFMFLAVASSAPHLGCLGQTENLGSSAPGPSLAQGPWSVCPLLCALPSAHACFKSDAQGFGCA